MSNLYGVIKIELIKGSGRRQSRPEPWVARIKNFDGVYNYKRDFIASYVDDYSHTSKSGARGIYRYFALPPGVYEVYKAISWRHNKRYFVYVDKNGDVSTISKDQVDEWLKNATSE
jgi:hypothetical protein